MSTFLELKEQLIHIMNQIKTHDELKVIHKLYRKRWYEIDSELVIQFKTGDFIKWYKKKKVQWGVITETKDRGRFLKAISVKGSEWKLGGSVIERVVDPTRIRKMITQLEAQGVKIEVKNE